MFQRANTKSQVIFCGWANGNWHKYNSEFGYKARIQSAEYSDKYEYTLKQKSYNTIGTKQVSGKSIMLYSKDAQWIYEHCKDKTVINIIKGGKNDKLPLEFEQTNPLLKHCNWDPTDSSKSNPYRKAQNGKIILGTSTLTVERGATPNYLANLIAKDENGKDVSSMVKYKKINTDSTGTYKVTYTYKTAAGIKLEAVQKIKVVDTTPPKVVCSKDLFQYEVTSLDKKDLNTDANVKAIESMVRSTVSCNESGVKITVTCARKNELSEGKNPVTVTAEDSAGNVGAYNVQCEITIKKVKPGKPYKPTKEQQELINRRKEESKRNNKKDSDKKKDSSDKKKTEAATKSDKGNSEKETSKKSSDKKEDETIVNE